jgi:hypothetical protein
MTSTVNSWLREGQDGQTEATMCGALPAVRGWLKPAGVAVAYRVGRDLRPRRISLRLPGDAS